MHFILRNAAWKPTGCKGQANATSSLPYALSSKYLLFFPLRNKLKGNRGGIVRSGGKTENGSHTDTWRNQPDTEEAGKQDGQCIDQ